MTRAKKNKMKKDIIDKWYKCIVFRGGFCRHHGDIERLTLKIARETNYSKSNIKKYFWKNVYTDKNFINEYEY